MDRVLELIQLRGAGQLLGRARGLDGVDELGDVDGARDVDRLGAIDVLGAVVGKVGEELRGVEPRRALRLVLALQAEEQRLEVVEGRGVDLVVGVLEVDEGVVPGRDDASLEAEVLPAAGDVEVGGEVELREAARLALERALDRRVEAARLGAGRVELEAEIEVAARIVLARLEGLVEDLLRVLVAAAAAGDQSDRDQRNQGGEQDE